MSHQTEPEVIPLKAILIAVLPTLAAPLTSTCYAEPNKEQYELQERCGRISKKAFEDEWGRNGVVTDKDNQIRANYQNHYNVKLNKCFFLTSTFLFPKDKTQSVHEDVLLYDINENKEYGNFHRMFSYNGPYGDTAPVNCYVREKQCRSRNEWESLIKPYMEE